MLRDVQKLGKILNAYPGRGKLILLEGWASSGSVILPHIQYEGSTNYNHHPKNPSEEVLTDLKKTL